MWGATLDIVMDHGGEARVERPRRRQSHVGKQMQLTQRGAVAGKRHVDDDHAVERIKVHR